MIPKCVTLENFLSFGTKTEIKFDDDEPLWVLGGPNGVGKSAVFDAITYCLFGQHRGGVKGADQLVRHGENGFAVSFQFEFQGVDYRVTRGLASKRATQSVEQRAANTDDWKRVPNINAIADVKSWSERTLGMGFDAFKSSVLLRQGDSDAIIMAKGAERLEILKKIIGAERYETLSDRVHEATKKCRASLDGLKLQRDGLAPITAEQLEAAIAAVNDAESARSTASDAVENAAKLLEQARLWANLSPKIRDLETKIHAAETRRNDSDVIRANYQRLTELAGVMPTLKAVLPLRDGLGGTKEKFEEIVKQHQEKSEQLTTLNEQIGNLQRDVTSDTATADGLDKSIKELCNEIARTEKLKNAAEELAAIDREVQQFDPNLDVSLETTDTQLATATADERTALNELASCKSQLKAAKAECDKYANLEIGVTCSECGLEVTAVHAEKERARTVRVFQERAEAASNSVAIAKTATDAVSLLKTDQKRLADEVQKRERLRVRSKDKRHDLETLGGVADVTQLTDRLLTMTANVTRDESQRDSLREKCMHGQRELNRLVPEIKQLTKTVTLLAGQRETLEKQLAADTTRCETMIAQLPVVWQQTPSAELSSLDQEQRQLNMSGVAEKHGLLQQDEARRDEWVEQLTECCEQTSSIPGEARIMEAQAQQSEQQAKQAVRTTQTQWQSVRDAKVELTRKADVFDKLRQQIVTVETDFDQHKKLDDLLGKSGLQRELVRDAEEQIVRLANDTVGNLSDGDLSIELDKSDDSDDKAFSLRIRRADDPTPIAVEYLSGSQKFRVAIAVALAIGRFASGQVKPLESVIIDEGFGSLDKNGLRATAEELNRLKQYLRRIVLVSHQEEFTENFPVVIQLSHSDTGTNAEPVRRR